MFSYYKLHSTLIPQASSPIPLLFTSSPTQSINISPALSEFDPLINYRWIVNLDLFCGDILKGKFIPVDYKILIEENKPLYSGFFILDCDSRYSHNANNDLVPYNLRFWLPPILVNFERKLSLVLDKFISTGEDLSKFASSPLAIQLEPIPGLIIDSSFLSFQMEFTGFRYYIVKYRFISFLIGVIAFWSTSSALCSVTALYVLGLNHAIEELDDESDNELKRIDVEDDYFVDLSD